MDRKKGIYLDYAAATPLDPEVFSAMESFYREDFANPSSMHSSGREVKKHLETARAEISQLLNCETNEIIFTHNGTEANNIALQGAAFSQAQKGKHIITTRIEHPSVLNTCRHLEKNGFEITNVPVNERGLVLARDVLEAVRPDTIIVSVIYAQNEIGTIQPVQTIGQRLKEKFPHVIFHSDACQAAASLELDVKKLRVDLMTISSSKIYGPKGAALLYKRNNTNLAPLLFGGDQEQKLQPGTENTAAIIGLAHSLKKITRIKKAENSRLQKLQNGFIKMLQKELPDVIINGDLRKRIPTNIHFSVPGLDSDSLLMLLDRNGLFASSGSACKSGDMQPSETIVALQGEKAYGAAHVRVSLGHPTTEKEIRQTVNIIQRSVSMLRA